MEKYNDLQGDSGVIAYEDGNGYIRVKFKDGNVYLYDDAHTGCENIAKMKILAANGDGLNSFIMKNVRKKYAKKEI
ncbi:MAG: hypothetical protein PHC34_13470 [Candidatus Gastranaerophilales bacterium]|nr:hypothetical protein [Candidatus Gastranaerophilales bacterium]